MEGEATRRFVPGQQLLEIWEKLPEHPEAQLLTVREYATHVLGGELSAAAWLGRANDAVLDGACLVSEASRTRAGFRDAMRELIRIDAGA